MLAVAGISGRPTSLRERTSGWGRCERLAPYLEGHFVEFALESSSRIRTPEHQGEALEGLLPRLAKLGQPERAFRLGAEFQGVFTENFRARQVKDIAPHLTSSLIDMAMQFAVATSIEHGRKEAIAALARRSVELSTDVVEKMWPSIVANAAGGGAASYSQT